VCFSHRIPQARTEAGLKHPQPCCEEKTLPFIKGNFKVVILFVPSLANHSRACLGKSSVSIITKWHREEHGIAGWILLFSLASSSALIGSLEAAPPSDRGRFDATAAAAPVELPSLTRLRFEAAS